MPHGRTRSAATAGVLALLIMLAAAGTASANRLTQLPGPGGCIVVVVVSGCTQQASIGSPNGVVVRGTHVYAASTSDNRINIYDRNTSTGGLTPRAPGSGGCIADDGGNTGCRDAKGLLGPTQMALSPDGLTLYVLAQTSQGVAVLNRDPATGSLSQSNTINACITRTGGSGSDSCAVAAPIDAAIALTLSADGQDVYVIGHGTGSSPANGGGFITLLDVVSGGLSQHTPMLGGCFENVVATAGCSDGPAMSGGRRVAIPPDGKHVYATWTTANAVGTFTRDSVTGALGLPTDENDRCLEQDAGPSPDLCRRSELVGTEVFPIAFANDGRGYVGGLTSGSVTVLNRNSTTGGLTVPGPCASSATTSPFAACTDIPNNMFGLVDIDVVPDRSAMIVGGRFGRGLTAFTFGADGGPIPTAPPAGCIATGGLGFTTTCALPRGFARAFAQDFGPADVALSENGRFVYAVSPQANEDRAGLLGAFRDTAKPVCQDATVDMTGGQQLALPLTCTDADGDAITLTVLTMPARGITGQLDQNAKTVTYAAPTDFDGTETLTFKGTSNGVDSNTATVTIRITKPSAPPVTTPPVTTPPVTTPPVTTPPVTIVPGADRILSPVISAFTVFKRFTKVKRLQIRLIPAGAKVEVRCRGKGCPFKRRSFTPRRGTVNATSRLRKARLRRGVRLEVRITKAGLIGKVVTYRVNGKDVPRGVGTCLPPGVTKPTRC